MVNGTHENIITAFFRIAHRNPNKEEISLSEIADEAGITRQDIYAKHFSCVSEIKKEIYQSIDDQIYYHFIEALEKHSAQKNIYEIICIAIIPEIYEKRNWIKILYSSRIDSQWESFLKKRYINLFSKYYADRLHTNTTMSLEESSDIICQYILSLFSIWLTSDLPDPPSVFEKKFLAILQIPPINLATISDI